jgi:hypothetical protein
MKLLRIAMFVGTLMGSAQVLATSFDGPWFGAGMGFRGQNTEISDNRGNDINGIGKDSMYGVVQAGWGFVWHTSAGDFNLGPYAFYLLGTTESNTVVPGGLVSAYVKWKNQWGIGLQPGYFLSKDTVLYLKVGFNQTTGQLNLQNAQGQVSPQDQFSGPGVGLGMKHELGNGVTIFVDAQQQYYRDKTYTAGNSSITIKPKMTMGTFGFGYQF